MSALSCTLLPPLLLSSPGWAMVTRTLQRGCCETCAALGGAGQPCISRHGYVDLTALAGGHCQEAGQAHCRRLGGKVKRQSREGWRCRRWRPSCACLELVHLGEGHFLLPARVEGGGGTFAARHALHPSLPHAVIAAGRLTEGGRPG